MTLAWCSRSWTMALKRSSAYSSMNVAADTGALVEMGLDLTDDNDSDYWEPNPEPDYGPYC